MKQQRLQNESGFAMLFVFVMAAVIAIGLYYEMPRVAFESQRAREQLLVDRGMQYRRAIQLFYRKFGRYPTTMDELETTNNIRFLRHKYKDPLTGKDDWRLVHMGPGGMLTDSLVQKPVDPLNKDKDQSASTGTDPNGNPQDQTAGLNLATVRRPSDGMAAGPPGATGQPGQIPDPNNPGQILNPTPSQPLLPGQVPPPSPVQFPQPVQPYNPNNPYPQPQPVTPLQPYDPSNPNPPQPPPGFVQGRGGFVPQSPAYPGAPTPVATQTQTGAGTNQATGLIQNLLNTPRQPPSTLSAASSLGTTTQIGGGIAGVASKYPGSGIKLINDRKKYKEWEFVYDFKLQQQIPGQQITGQPGQPGAANPLGGNLTTGAAGTAGTTGSTTSTPSTTSH